MDKRFAWFLAIGFLIALLIAGVASRFASSEPDGLERVAIDQGFDDDAEEHVFADAPLADYSVDGSTNDGGTGIAGIIGVVTTAVLVTGMLWGIRRLTLRRRNLSP